MLLIDILDRVRYPDEPVALFDDRTSYDSALAVLETAMQLPSLRADAAETIAELIRRKEQRETRK